MQDLTDHLLTHLSEEAAEIVQRVQKISRFGLDEIQDGKTQTNRERLAEEVNQLEAVLILLRQSRVIPWHNATDANAKMAAIREYAQLSYTRGRLDQEAFLQLNRLKADG